MTAQTQQPLSGTYDRSEMRYRNFIANLQETLAKEREKLKKLSELYNTYNTYVWEGTDFALADVIPSTITIEGSSNELMIACRKPNGLSKGQFVLGEECIIGRISDVFPQISKAKVVLITDPTSKIPVKGAGFESVMKGTGNNSAKIEMVRKKVEVGESVFVYKNPEFQDAPLKVGEVSKCERNQKDPLLWDLTVEPACNIRQLEDVAIIIMNMKK